MQGLNNKPLHFLHTRSLWAMFDMSFWISNFKFYLELIYLQKFLYKVKINVSFAV